MIVNKNDTVRAVKWHDDHLSLLDQRLLPETENYLQLSDVEQVSDSIRQMAVRGAPAIGITAAYGVVLAARKRYQSSPDNWKHDIENDLKILASSRPTAVNLFWALRRMQDAFKGITGDPHEPLLNEAISIHKEDITANYRMGELGSSLISTGSSVLTHCNTGSLATGGYGTALGVIRHAWQENKLDAIFADETRPWLQGSRLTAWELNQDNIPVTLLVDSAASALMNTNRIHWVIVGADRVAANGDVANKIGTYSLAVNARYHGVRFMVVAPTSTIDLETPDGSQIPVEQRDANEILCWQDKRMAAQGVGAWNPVFDITPAGLIDALVTERGIVEQPDPSKISALFP